MNVSTAAEGEDVGIANSGALGAHRYRWAAAVLLLAVLTRLPALVHPRAIDDEGIYAVVALEIVDGGKPYVDAIERKPPLLFWTYASVFRMAGKYNWAALHSAAVFWTLLTMVGLYAVARRLFDHTAGLSAALLYGVYQSWAYWKNLAFNGEILMNLPVVWGVLLTLRPSTSRMRPELFAAGALLGCAFLLKQPAAVAAVPLGVYLLLPSYRASRRIGIRHSILHATLLTVGFFGVLGVIALVLQAQGILDEAYYWTIIDHDVPHGVTDAVFWTRGLSMAVAFTGACSLLIVCATLSLKAGCKGDTSWWTGHRAEFIAIVGLLLASLVGTSASGRFYPHYFIQLLPPLALLAAPALSRLWTRIDEYRLWLLRPGVTKGWLALTVVGFLIAHAIGLADQRSETAIGRYIRATSTPGDRIFVWGQHAAIYLDARRRPASRYVTSFPLTGYIFGSPLGWDPTYDTSHRILPGAWENLEHDFREHAPLYIVDSDASRGMPRYPTADFPMLRQLLHERYQVVHRTPEGVVYRLLESGESDQLSTGRGQPVTGTRVAARSDADREMT
jgi:4-amino-4-deoxy-L-arabinose transferase-like glycosyltransferase